MAWDDGCTDGVPATDAWCMSQTPRARFEALALPHLDTVYRVARSLASNDVEAEDLVQETYLRAFRAFAGFELREGGIKPWLLTILHNVFFTQRGRRQRVPEPMETSTLEQIRPGSSGEGVDERSFDWDRIDEEIKSAVFALQPEYRSVLLLWALEGMSYKEMADVCGCPIGTIMSRLHRARRLVNERLAKHRLGGGEAAEGQ